MADEPEYPDKFQGTLGIHSDGSVSIRLADGSTGEVHNINVALALDDDVRDDLLNDELMQNEQFNGLITDMKTAVKDGDYAADKKEILEKYISNPSFLLSEIKEYLNSKSVPKGP
ncbi:MAG: hypothetical protein JWR51_2294 [Devosia sp.]|uniref:hypothetical protein n=1 Tax=Devosia sp. TaxID=1871048 RepID=UPI0026308EDC|nr:hypothetical protein [Devosia sp.]MDB5529191.1 hypothetical protein [Devosia sp.]